MRQPRFNAVQSGGAHCCSTRLLPHRLPPVNGRHNARKYLGRGGNGRADAQTIDVCWNGRETVLANSSPLRPRSKRWLGPDAAKTHESAGRCVWDAEEKRLRVESNRFVIDRDGKGMSRTISVSTYDGTVYKTHLLQGEVVRFGRPPFVATWESGTYAAALADIQCLPLRLVYGRTQSHHRFVPGR